MRAPIALAAAALVVGVAAAGCGSDSAGTSSGAGTMSGGSTVEYDEQLSAEISDLSKHGRTRPLAELTDFGWDEVHVYSEGASADEVAKDVGSDVLPDDYYYDAGNLLVFSRGEEVERAVSVMPDLLTWSGSNAFGARVTLAPTGRAGGNGLLRLREPA